AVDVDLLHVVGELHAIQRLLVRESRIPELLGELRESGDTHLAVVVAHEVRLAVEDELAREFSGAVLGGAGRGGLGLRRGEYRAEYRVHRQERGRHAGAACKELPTIHAMSRRQLFGQARNLLLDAALVR